MIIQAAVALPQVRAGAIKAYAVTASSRFPAAPDIPTVDEAGLPGIHISGWFALFAPKGTPKPVIGTLNAAVVEALATYHKAEIEKWWPIIKAANIKGE